MALSIYSTFSVEDVARESPNTIKFLQMQFYTDRQLMVDLLKRAEKAAGADPGFFLGGGAPLRNDVTDGEVTKF